VAYLVFQTLYDFFPYLSYKLEFAKVFPFFAGSPADQARTIAVNFTLWNRTSRDAKFQCYLAPPVVQTPASYTFWSILNLRMRDRESLVPVSMQEFTVPANTGRAFIVQGQLISGSPEPSTLKFTIHDDRIGCRKWKREVDLEVPAFPKPIALVQSSSPET